MFGSFRTIATRLTVGLKISLILSLVAIPFALMTYLFVAQVRKDVSFASDELAGTQYLASIWPALVATAVEGPQAARPNGNRGHAGRFVDL
jgi:methyl-accepting chemotaxis protein